MPLPDGERNLRKEGRLTLAERLPRAKLSAPRTAPRTGLIRGSKPRPFLRKDGKNPLTAQSSDLLLLGVFGEHCTIRLNGFLVFFFFFNSSKFFIEMQSLVKRYEKNQPLPGDSGESGYNEGKVKFPWDQGCPTRS